MEVLDLFSAAAGGWSLGMHRAGFTTIAACEVEAWRRAIYAENNPDVRLYDDVRTLTAARLLDDLGRLPAVVVGSPPCQDISSANTKGRGVEGERSGLYFEAIRIIGEVRPRWFALENSANLRTRGADAVITALEALGYACWPCVVRAGDIGANHERPRAWLIGCDLAQVADPDGERWDEGRGWGWRGLDLSVSASPRYANSDVKGAEREVRGWADTIRSRSSTAHAAGEGHAGRSAVRSGWEARDQHARGDDAGCARSLGGGNTPDPDQAGQADGRMVAGLRPAQVADDGRGIGWGADRAGAGQVELCPPDRGDPDGSWADWSLEHLADHLRLDDGLSARLAGTRVVVGDGKGQSAASLVVEAFGDAVVPQIPEAIGRAILRTEAALGAIYGMRAAA